MHRSKHSQRKKNLYTRVGLLDPSVLQKNEELWAHPPVLTPVPSQAIHSYPLFAVGSRLVKIVRNWLSYSAPWSVFRNSNDQRIKNKQTNKLVFLSVTVWEPGTGGQDVETPTSRSHFPHDEMDTAPNSQMRQRTVVACANIGYRRRYDV